MPDTFPARILAALDAAREIAIHTGTTPPSGTIIWVVVADGAAYLRSYRGRRGKWYGGALADPAVAVTLDGRTIRGRVAPVDDPARIAAVSAAFALKYAGSPYLAPMQAAEARATTLLLSP